MKTGLCSVTFRKKNPEDIIKIASEAGLQVIEWGGDVHVPPGDLAYATKVGELTRNAGLEVSSYGSYYRAGDNESILPIIQTAQSLGTTSIRIWAGVMDRSKEVGKINEEDFNRIVKDVKESARIAREYEMSLHLEYHRWTYTDTPESSKLLMEAINEPNVFLYWQPATGITKEDRLKSIELLQPWLTNIHVFQWDENFRRYSLEDGKNEWKSYINHIESLSPVERSYLLEFVKDEDVTQFKQDVETLKQFFL
ncbi:sugar phosphate isomerase/epimerase family protein [Bacillus timonensis]|uniref:sugar phosphate isomerase/epimerase family protein n=1 Tax=Bacillus timonensis TaxID=1033734 RepID=UPI0009FF9E5D|nr:TIM barrel protein [Bacillus timonensis]